MFLVSPLSRLEYFQPQPLVLSRDALLSNELFFSQLRNNFPCYSLPPVSAGKQQFILCDSTHPSPHFLTHSFFLCRYSSFFLCTSHVFMTHHLSTQESFMKLRERTVFFLFAIISPVFCTGPSTK